MPQLTSTGHGKRMERAAFASTCVQPSLRAARKSEWLRSTLAHYHRPDPGVDNEIVVLAMGVDQYMQEVFHHLAYPNRDDKVSAADFTALCAVLGLSKGTGTGKDEEFADVCAELPAQLSFKDFHARLCAYFRVRNAREGSEECMWRLPVSEDTELVERHIRLRCPRARRRKCVSFDLTHEQTGSVRERPVRGASALDTGTGCFLLWLHRACTVLNKK